MDRLTTKIYIVRHGQSEGNLIRQILGHTDRDLTELGFRQAEKCADFLSKTHIDKIYSSDLTRAFHTAVPHAKIRGIDVEKACELRELYFGEWEGASVCDVENTPKFQIEWKENFGIFTAPGGESVQTLATRIYDFIEKRAVENPGKSLLFVFHAAAIRSFWGKISEIPPEKLASEISFPLNASVSCAEYKEGKIVPIEYSNASFL